MSPPSTAYIIPPRSMKVHLGVTLIESFAASSSQKETRGRNTEQSCHKVEVFGEENRIRPRRS